MRIGLFLDVDNTLTAGFIQQTFARLLLVEPQYIELETKFQSGTVTSFEFGESIIRLFTDAGFDRDFAEKNYYHVRIAPWAEKILSLPVEKYLVSAGPSYFVKPFAQRNGVPTQNVLCSEYRFNDDGKLIGCEAVNADRKRQFRFNHAGKHFITIGVGDDPRHDGPFVTGCDIPILTVRTPDSLYAENLGIVLTLVERLASRPEFKPSSRTPPTLFIASSSEQSRWANALHGLVENDCRPSVWAYDVFGASQTTIEGLEGALDRFDFAAFIMHPDDINVVRHEHRAAVRENVLFELGLFMGRLGRNRCFLLHSHQTEPSLPTDLAGITTLKYDGERPADEARSALISSADRIRDRVRGLGPVTAT